MKSIYRNYFVAGCLMLFRPVIKLSVTEDVGDC